MKELNGYSEIRTIYDELGRSWVEISDELWRRRQYFEYINGWDIT